MTEAISPFLVNLGCGVRFHPAWRNFDIIPQSPSVEIIDLWKPLPFTDSSLDAIYASHVLEHLPRSRVPSLLNECRRVIKPGGILRLVVPDLEGIVRNYLMYLDRVVAGDESAKAGHEWMTLELLDQMVRTESGGFMARLWNSRPLPARNVVRNRFGKESMGWIEAADRRFEAEEIPLTHSEVYETADLPFEDVAKFRATGEVHLWMYDQVSLAGLLQSAGFEAPRKRSAIESDIPNFVVYCLDTDEDGIVRKPDSLFMEATVPL